VNSNAPEGHTLIVKYYKEQHKEIKIWIHKTNNREKYKEIQIQIHKLEVRVKTYKISIRYAKQYQ
jgi:hypothetical protein